MPSEISILWLSEPWLFELCLFELCLFELCLFEPVPSRFRAESSVCFFFLYGAVGFVYFLFSIRFWRPERYCCDDH